MRDRLRRRLLAAGFYSRDWPLGWHPCAARAIEAELRATGWLHLPGGGTFHIKRTLYFDAAGVPSVRG